jgi:hypothetical protein
MAIVPYKEFIMTHAQKNIEIALLETSVKSAHTAILELRRYMNSLKFHCGDGLDNYINTSDVHNRLDIITGKLLCNNVQLDQ